MPKLPKSTDIKLKFEPLKGDRRVGVMIRPLIKRPTDLNRARSTVRSNYRRFKPLLGKIRQRLWLVPTIFILSGLSIGMVQSYASDQRKKQETLQSYVKAYQTLVEQKTDTDAILEQKSLQEASLRARIEELERQLQSKRSEEQRIASSTGGYGGSYQTPISLSNTYTPGQCTWGVASWIEVPSGLGNANTWDDRARTLGYTVSPIPKIGVVAQTDAGRWGHTALVVGIEGIQVLVKEMNYYGPYIVDERWALISSFIYIYF